MKLIKKLSLLLLVITSFVANAQTDKATTARIVEAKNFKFVATSALPLNFTDVSKVLSRMPGNVGAGGTIDLSGSQYDLAIKPDTIKAYLPFYGRAFTADLNPNDSGYKFSSKDFDYTTSKRKKGGWNVLINTKDVRNNARMNLTIGENGYAVLSVVSNNKQSITYNGYISEIKEPARSEKKE